MLASSCDAADVCCIDVTGSNNATFKEDMGLSDWQSGGFEGTLVLGANYWTDMPDVHNDGAYQTQRSECTQPVGACNQEIMQAWVNAVRPGKFGV